MEVEAAKRRARGAGAWGLNTIVMNAVLEACVRCGDVDLALRLFEDMRRPRGCGVDGVSYGILLKIDMARGLLRRMVNEKEYFSWTSRVGLIILNDPVEKYMIPFQETRPLLADLISENVVMRFFKDRAVPLVDDWGSCVGIVHGHDCTKLDAPLLAMARPPLCVPTSTSVEHVRSQREARNVGCSDKQQHVRRQLRIKLKTAGSFHPRYPGNVYRRCVRLKQDAEACNCD